MVEEVLSPLSEGLSLPFLSLFVPTFDIGGDGGGDRNIIRLPLRIGIMSRQ